MLSTREVQMIFFTVAQKNVSDNEVLEVPNGF